MSLSGHVAPVVVMRLVMTLRKGKERIAAYANRLIEAHRRRVAYKEEFYRRLNEHCRANNVSPYWEDDWRSLVDR